MLWGVSGLVEMGSRVHLKQTINSRLILQTCSVLSKICIVLRSNVQHVTRGAA